MKSKSMVVLALSLVFSGAGVVLADPVPALAPQAVPPEAIRAIDAVNQAAENMEVPVFDGRALSIGVGAIAGVLVYNMLPGGRLVSRAAAPIAATRMGAAVASSRAAVAGSLPVVASAVAGGLVGDYLYRKSNHVPSIPADVAGRVAP